SWFLIEAPRRVRREGVDVSHAASSLAALRPGCPSVMTVHDATLLTARSRYGWVDRLYHQVFSVLPARRAEAVIVPSVSAGRDIARGYPVPSTRLPHVHHPLAPPFRHVTSVGASSPPCDFS